MITVIKWTDAAAGDVGENEPVTTVPMADRSGASAV
jgi:hypothetical protein